MSLKSKKSNKKKVWKLSRYDNMIMHEENPYAKHIKKCKKKCKM